MFTKLQVQENSEESRQNNSNQIISESKYDEMTLAEINSHKQEVTRPGTLYL